MDEEGGGGAAAGEVGSVDKPRGGCSVKNLAWPKK